MLWCVQFLNSTLESTSLGAMSTASYHKHIAETCGSTVCHGRGLVYDAWHNVPSISTQSEYGWQPSKAARWFWQVNQHHWLQRKKGHDLWSHKDVIMAQRSKGPLGRTVLSWTGVTGINQNWLSTMNCMSIKYSQLQSGPKCEATICIVAETG